MRIAVVVVLAGCWGSADPPPAKPAPVSSTAAAEDDHLRNTLAEFRGNADPASCDLDNSNIYGGNIVCDPRGSGRGSVGTGDGRDGMRPRTFGPNVWPGQAEVSAGGVDPAIVRRYIKRSLMRVEDCYTRVLAHKPGLSGSVLVTFTIGVNGSVVKIDANGLDPDVARCIADVIKSIEFPRSKTDTDTEVRFPFELRPR